MVEDTQGGDISNYRDGSSSIASIHDKERKWRFVFQLFGFHAHVAKLSKVLITG
jgi:hypothetical protein